MTIPTQKETMLIVDSPSERLMSMVPIPIAIRFRRPIITSISSFFYIYREARATGTFLVMVTTVPLPSDD